MGGTYLKDGKAVLDSKEGVAALDLYARQLRQYAPPYGSPTGPWPV
jgi:hypothetical protein